MKINEEREMGKGGGEYGGMKGKKRMQRKSKAVFCGLT